jgi:hypothetical protein
LSSLRGALRSKADKIDAQTIWRCQSLIPIEKIQIPVIDQEAKMLASYLTSYQFAQGQRVGISNHPESVTDKDLRKLLQKELLRKQQLIHHHKSKKVAVIAAMRQLLLVAHAIYQNKTEYVPG